MPSLPDVYTTKKALNRRQVARAWFHGTLHAWCTSSQARSTSWTTVFQSHTKKCIEFSHIPLMPFLVSWWHPSVLPFAILCKCIMTYSTAHGFIDFTVSNTGGGPTVHGSNKEGIHTAAFPLNLWLLDWCTLASLAHTPFFKKACQRESPLLFGRVPKVGEPCPRQHLNKLMQRRLLARMGL